MIVEKNPVRKLIEDQDAMAGDVDMLGNMDNHLPYKNNG